MNDRRVMVIYSGWLGDLVWIVPAIRALKTVFGKVSLVVSAVQAELAAILKNGLVEEVYVDTPSRRLATARAVRRAALADGTATFIDLKGRWKTGIYIPWRRGLRVWLPDRMDAREYALARLVHPFASLLPRRTGEHMVDSYLSGLAGLGIGETRVSFDLPFSEATVGEGEKIAEREDLRGSASVALNIGSAQFSKIWPAENYRHLAEILEGDLGCKAVIMGARSFAPNGDYDLKVSREVFGGARFTNLVEQTGLAVDAYLLRSGIFSLAIGNDSFAGHVAGSADEVDAGAAGAERAANGRWYKANHTITLFGATNPVFCRPYDPTGVFNTPVLPGSYPSDCPYDRRAHTCPHYGDRYCLDGTHCMRNLTVDQVVTAVEKKLGELKR